MTIARAYLWALAAQDRHESGDWTQSGDLFCAECEAPVQHPCLINRMAAFVERITAPLGGRRAYQKMVSDLLAARTRA